jgi:hypothetical protein
MRRSSAIAAILAILAIPVAVQAQSQVDPRASSPAGAVYEIPLQTARKDAAPHRTRSQQPTGSQQQQQQQSVPATGGGGSAGGGGGGSNSPAGVLPEGSDIKSENGYGSSSKVPGLAGGTKAGDADPKADTAAAESSPPQRASAESDPVPSNSASYGLIVLIVLGGASLGIAAATAVRRNLGGAG